MNLNPAQSELVICVNKLLIMVTQSEILVDNFKITALNNSNAKVKNMGLSSKVVQNMDLYHILYHSTVVCFQSMPYLAYSYMHCKCPTGFKDLTEKSALRNGPMNSTLFVCPSVTNFSYDCFITFF